MTHSTTRSAVTKAALALASLLFVIPVMVVFAPTASAHTSKGNATPGNDSAHPWKSNGCGPSWAGFVIPDKKAGVFNFNHACDHHDGCYIGFPRNGKATYWASRRTCDSWFLGDMLASCKYTHGADLTKTAKARECKSKSYLYHQAVRDYGFWFYKGPSYLQA